MAKLTAADSIGLTPTLEQALQDLTRERFGVLDELIDLAESAHARGDLGPAMAAAGLVLVGEHLRAASFKHGRRARALLPLGDLPGAPQTAEELLFGAAAVICEAYGSWPADRLTVLRTQVRAWVGQVRSLSDRRLPADILLLWACALGEWCERHGEAAAFEGIAAVAALADADPTASPWLRAHWCVVQAWHLQAFGRTGAADNALQRAAQLADGAGLSALQAMVWLQHARLTLWRTDGERARETAARAASRGDAHQTPVWLADQADVECRVALRAGDHAQALAHARRANAWLQLADAPPSYDATYAVNQAYALVGVGSFEKANELFSGLQTASLPPYLAARVEVLKGLALLTGESRLGRWNASSDARLAQALHRLRELEWPNVFVFLPQQMAELFARALEAGLESAWICQAIQSRDLAPPALADESWPWPVRIRVLGAFACDVNGRPLMAEGGKAASRPLALLRRLAVLAGHEGVSAESLARGLWPGEGREGRDKALETTLARLRKLLGVADAVQLHDHRLRLNPLRVWIDASMFVRVLDRIHGPDPHEASWRRAFLLYRGPLLADEPDPWVQPWRDRLRALLAAALLTTRQASGDDERWLRACAADPAVACHRAGSGPVPLATALPVQPDPG